MTRLSESGSANQLSAGDHTTNSPAITPTLRASARRSVFWVAAAAGVLGVALIAALMAGGESAGRTLASDNAAPIGGRALAEVLRQQGVTVMPVGSLTEARAAAAAADDATVFFSDADGFLNESGLDDLTTLAPRTVIAAPDFLALQSVAPEVGFGGVGGDSPAPADCSLPAAVRAGSVSPSGDTLRIPGGAGAGDNDAGTDDAGAIEAGGTVSLTGCFPSGDGSFSVVDRADGERSTTLVADAAVFSNDGIGAYGNAALALNLLGAGDTVIWYLPTLADVARTGPPSLGELTPGWLTPTLMLFGLVFVAAAVWRGRRFGPLVAENLPVTVRASETMEGRARLYARSDSRLRALDALRVGAAQRLAALVGLGRTAHLDEIVSAVAMHTGAPVEDVRGVLVEEQPNRDADLMRLSARLDQLERDTIVATHPAAQPPASPHDTSPHGRMDS